MKKAVLISIAPKWCALISSGEKTLELRKTFPQEETPFKCYIYETQGKTDTPWMDEDGHMVFRGRGAVIGEFVCDRMERFDVPFPAYMDQVDTRLLKAACLSYREAHAYLGHRSGCGWHISDLKIYEKPKRIFDFIRPACERVSDCGAGCSFWCGSLRRCLRNYTVLFPPQSWMYVEELP